jgi:kojibiose phosphorylase
MVGINVNKRNIIEQFDGYFKLKKVTLARTDENGIPLIPVRIKPKDLGKTRLVKQADVIMLLCLLEDVFSRKTKMANYDFYIRRTVHKSSLSPSIHALIASWAGDLSRAYNLFKVSLRTDISNVYNNTHEGIHAASLGGTWQAVVFGFAGVKVMHERLTVNPHLPRAWKRMTFSLAHRGTLLRLDLTNETIKIKIHAHEKKELTVGIFNKWMRIMTNKAYTFSRVALKGKGEEFY